MCKMNDIQSQKQSQGVESKAKSDQSSSLGSHTTILCLGKVQISSSHWSTIGIILIKLWFWKKKNLVGVRTNSTSERPALCRHVWEDCPDAMKVPMLLLRWLNFQLLDKEMISALEVPPPPVGFVWKYFIVIEPCWTILHGSIRVKRSVLYFISTPSLHMVGSVEWRGVEPHSGGVWCWTTHWSDVVLNHTVEGCGVEPHSLGVWCWTKQWRGVVLNH